MFQTVRIVNPRTKEEKELNPRFSFTSFFFPVIVPIFRKDLPMFLFMFFCSMVIVFLNSVLDSSLTWPISIIWRLSAALIYNKAYIKAKLADGWEGDHQSAELLKNL